MTIDDAKRELPNILVQMPDGKTYNGRVTGRALEFPMVSVQYDGKLHSKGHRPWIDFQSTWAQIARKATDGTSIIYC